MRIKLNCGKEKIPFGGVRSWKKKWAKWNKFSDLLVKRVRSQNGISIDEILKELGFNKCGSGRSSDVYNGAALAENMGKIKAQYGRLYIPGTQPPMKRLAEVQAATNHRLHLEALERNKKLAGRRFGVWDVLSAFSSDRPNGTKGIMFRCKCSKCGKLSNRMQITVKSNWSCICQYRGEKRAAKAHGKLGVARYQ